MSDTTYTWLQGLIQGPQGPQGAPGTGGGSSALSNVFYVDGAAAAEGTGAIGDPYKTITNALAEHAEGGIFILCPHDYSGESPLSIPASVKVQLIGIGIPSAGTAYAGTHAVIPGIIQTVGGEQGSLVIQNLECSGNLDIGASVVAIDCIGVFIEGQGTDKGFVDLRGCETIGITCSGLAPLTGCLIGNGAAINTLGTSVQMVDCSYDGAKPDVTFTGSAGIVSYDRITLFRAGGGTVCNSVTNGTEAAF